MALYRDRNWAFLQPPILADGDVIEHSNLCQLLPHTALTGLRDRAITLRRCNLINVQLGPVWILENCNVTQIEFCAHLHSEMGLTPEPEDCQHLTSIDVVDIDGEQLVFRTYKDKVVS